MAEEFLRKLPQVGEADLPEGGECGICQEKYGKADPQTGTVETPVRLPCQHILGSDCIGKWVSPNEYGNKTCPFCRTIQPPGITDEDRQEARLSLRANERLLYEELQSEGSHLPALNEHGTLNAEQETALFEELVRARAFEGLLGLMSSTDYRMLWDLMRQDGFVFVQDCPAMGGCIRGWRTMTAAGSWYFVPSDEFAWPTGSGSLIGEL